MTTNRFGVRGSRFGVLTLVLAAAIVGATTALAAPAPDSKRMAAAKDAIADEQWARAVAELKVVADDPKEANRDEALFWLAHSQHQAGDQAGAVETIARLERTFPRSPWVRPARSLRIEIAQRLNRDDVLWRIAVPPPPPPAPAAIAAPTPAPAPPAPAPRPAVVHGPRTPAPVAAPQPAVPPATAPPSAIPPVPPPPPMPGIWMPEAFAPDMDLRIQALGSLLDAHPDRVIPLLREIALDPSDARDGRRAVFVLAQSSRPEARMSVVDVAQHASEPVRIAAIREMGRFPDPAVAAQLMQVYASTRASLVKREVVASLGVRADTPALARIARTEADPFVRDTAIVRLGRAGGRAELRAMYQAASHDSRAAILVALFAARADEDLIQIASTERNAALRAQARRQLQLLGTPKALAFLEKK